MVRVGERVGAVLSSTGDEVLFLGYGVYEGDAVPREAVGFMADALRGYGHKNPCLLLDSGKRVFGCECWWGSEACVREMLDGYRALGRSVVETDIDSARQDFLKGAEGA